MRTIFALAFALSLAGCGSDDEGDPGGGNELVGVTTFNVSCTAGGSNVCPGNYGINDLSDPTIELVRGQTYTFNVTAGPSHPFVIKTVGGQTGANDSFDDGVTGQGATNGTLTFVVPMNAPDTLFYQCTIHAGMTGTIRIVDP